MRDSRFEELISAYLDGELPADERLLVEQQIAESVQLRQLFEDLKRQHETLSALPRYQPPADLAARIVARIQSSLPAPAVRVESYAAPNDETNVRRKLPGWKTMAAAAVALAACLFAAFLPTLIHRDIATRPKEPESPRAEMSVDLATFKNDFANKFRFLFIYDFAITPKGQQNRIFEKWMETAGLHVEKSIVIEKRLEKGVLDGRFVGDDKIVAGGIVKDVSKDDVEMIFVRTTAGKIDDLGRLWQKSRNTVNDEIHLRMDMAMSAEDLWIFLQLNDAVNPFSGDRLGFIESWTKPGTYRLQFQPGLHSVSSSRSDAIPGAPLKPTLASPEKPPASLVSPTSVDSKSGAKTDPAKSADALAKEQLPPVSDTNLSALGTAPEDPSQVLIIVRKLKDDFPKAAVTNAAKAP